MYIYIMSACADMICFEVSQRVSDLSITCPGGRGDPSRHVVSSRGKIITALLRSVPEGGSHARAHTRARTQTRGVNMACTPPHFCPYLWK